MARIRCFIVERTGRAQYHLRRYSNLGRPCGDRSYHNATGADLGQTEDNKNEKWLCSNKPVVDPADPRWPTKCDRCDYLFGDGDPKQVFGEVIVRRKDTGEEMTLDKAPAGALWRADWNEDWAEYTGLDKQSWMCRLPGGHDWAIDGPASNCTRKGEPHKCWVRHGVAPDFNIDKNGDTCSAGAGSIAVPGYHGFLRNGYLED